MEIAKVKELNPIEIHPGLRMEKSDGRPCIYDSRIECTAPNLHLKICRTCPRATQYIQQNVVRLIFDRIKALTIMMLNNLGGGPQSAGSSGTGSAGSGGSGAGGGGSSGGGGSGG